MADRADVLVVGAGPAGIAAATAAAESGASTALIDDNEVPGGQIWRARKGAAAEEALPSIDRLRQSGARFLGGSSLIDLAGPGMAIFDGRDGNREMMFGRLVIATGAREIFLPFPGWTLPCVYGAGGLQALVKGGFRVAGLRVIVAGSGPLLIAVASYLREKGAHLLAVAEQAPISRIAGFGAGLALHPRKLGQAIAGLRRGGAYLAGVWPVEAYGSEKLEGVALSTGRRKMHIACDALACGFGLEPNVELAALAGCALERGFVKVDRLQKTSVEGIYCAGEPTGIGGLELSIVEGRIAGLAAAGREEEARALFGRRAHHLAFARLLGRTFELRPELRKLAGPDTVVCRCEDVRMAVLAEQTCARAAKIHTRCGMGPCQGRICGAATRFIFGWERDSARPPLSPAPLGALTHVEINEGENT